MAKNTLKFVLSVATFILSGFTFAADNLPAAESPKESQPCDFSSSQKPSSPQIAELFKRLEEAQKAQGSDAIVSTVDETWQELKTTCAGFDNANAIVWRLTQALDSTNEYEKALELNKNASRMSTSRADQHRFIDRAATQAIQAGKEGDALHLIEDYLAVKNLPVELWYLNKDQHRLQYSPAQLSAPLVAGQWMLANVFSTGRRDGSSVMSYTQHGDGIYNIADDYVTADITLHYQESDNVTPVPAVMQTKRPWLFTEKSAPDLASQLPDFPGSHLRQTKTLQHYTDTDNQPVTALWQIMQGKWQLTIEAKFLSTNRENAEKQLALLFNEIQWPQVENLAPLTSTLDELAQHPLQTQSQWQHAAAKVKPLLQKAKFPDEQGIINAIAGIDAYYNNKLPQAWRYLLSANAAYAQTSSTRASKSYDPQQVLIYLTDLAYRLKKSEYADMVNASLLSSSQHCSWKIDTSTKTLTSKDTGLWYPFNAGIFHATSFGRTTESIVYSSARYAYSVEFFAGLDAIPEFEQRNIVKRQMNNFQQNDLQKAPPEDKDLHKSTYVLYVDGHKKKATKWKTHWYSDNEKTEKTLIIWFLPYQNSTGGIIAVVNKKDNAVLSKLDEFAKKLMAQRPNSNASGETSHVCK